MKFTFLNEIYFFELNIFGVNWDKFSKGFGYFGRMEGRKEDFDLFLDLI